ncbi:MAG TPA: hypothetical protein VJB37_03165 [Patescibacteria group bacterium]|nr:hypothetical protein [Patescibacteria group bacterium]
MRLSLVVGQAMTVALPKQGINIGRINYQDNGNWSVFKPEGPYLHLHLYGRARNAQQQKFGQALYLPHREEQPKFYESLQPLNQKDCQAITQEILTLMSQEKFSNKNWGLNKQDNN